MSETRDSSEDELLDRFVQQYEQADDPVAVLNTSCASHPHLAGEFAVLAETHQLLARVRAEGYGFQIEMVYQILEHGGRVAEVPIKFVDRVEGKSKMSMHIVVEALLLVTWWALKRAGRVLVRGGDRRARSGAAV